MLNNLILASKSKVRKDILEKNGISCNVEPSNVDEDMVKESLLNKKGSAIKSSNDVNKGDTLKARLSKGMIDLEVK